ncbi:TetR/AcrR family transcriptional regulator [Dietzia sp. NCCP-2495]|uniref:TetR/AcrR family transcriptional regulator n=1 Tax=Dietzia sp. NCCP-2495 TaxID=2934675 RepID=UPI00222E8345|nr:TetR/AcrR family transcriptional regulator [Dietzia sp. NCCP-2495]
MTATPTHRHDPAAPLRVPEPGSRRAEIALVAAEEFSRRGYHATRVEHIAERRSVTAGALYRHVPSKYEMFRDAVATLAAELDVASSSPAGPGADGTPGAGGAPTPNRSPTPLGDLVASITRMTLRHRTRAALYRWQSRYLTAEDRAAVNEVDARVRRRLADAIKEERRRQRPHTDGTRAPGAGSAAAAILSCIASLGHHRIAVPDADVVALMTSIADELALAVPPPRPDPASDPVPEQNVAPARTLPPPDATPSTPAPSRLRGGAATREAAIVAAVARFRSQGYESVTMEAIGADVGVAASALYRHFPGKSALLLAAVDRTAQLVEELLDDHAVLDAAGLGADTGTDSEPGDLLAALLGQYVSIAFSHGPDLMLYHSELGSLAPEDLARLRQSQRRQLHRWASLVVQATPATPDTPAAPGAPRSDGRPEAESLARIRVHAALAAVLDGGQGTAFDEAVAPRFEQLAGIILIPH